MRAAVVVELIVCLVIAVAAAVAVATGQGGAAVVGVVLLVLRALDRLSHRGEPPGAGERTRTSTPEGTGT